MHATKSELRLRVFRLGDIQCIINSNDAEHVPALINDRKSRPVIALEQAHHFRKISACWNRDQRGLLKITHQRVGVCPDKQSKAHIKEECAGGINNIENVERFNTALRAADGIERLRNGHAGREADVLRRHHVAGGAFGVAKQCARCCERLRAERLQDPPRDFCWQVIKQRDAVIGRHGIDKLKHLLA